MVAFDRWRYELGPPLFELWTRHHAVLNGEDGHQHQIDDQGLRCRRRRSTVNGLWHHQIFDETNSVEEGHEEHDVGHDAIEEGDNPSDDITLAARVQCLDLGHNFLRSYGITGFAVEKGCQGAGLKALPGP